MNVIYSLFIRNLRDYTRDNIRLLVITLTPFGFIYVLSSIFKNQFASYSLSYLIAGVSIATVFNTSLNVASAVIDDIGSGFLKEILVSPISRLQVILGYILTGSTIATVQGFLIYLISMFTYLGFEKWHTLILVFFSMVMVSLVYSTLGILLAVTVKNFQTYQVVEQTVVIPLIFLSGAYLPISIFPPFLQYISYLNPMSYTTMFFRGIVLEETMTNAEMVNLGIALDINGFILTPLMSGLIVFLYGVLFMILAIRSFQKANFTSPQLSRKKRN